MVPRCASRLFLLAALLWVGFAQSAFALRAPSASAPVSSENRVGGSGEFASGRLSIEDLQSPENAMGCEGCDYESASGRLKWLNRDPIGENGGLNLYGFVGNNPVRWVDPYGLDYGDWWDPRTWFNGDFWGSIGDQAGSVGGTLKDTVTGDWGNIQNRYDDSTLGQAETAGPKTHLATKVCLGTATAATAAAAAVGGVEYFALGNQSLAEFNVLSEGNVFKVISRPLKGGFRVDPAHHGKPWGHTHWWGW